MIRKVMKGASVKDFSKITWPKIGSPKVDGFRCEVSDIARTSRMKEFPNRHVHKSLKGLLPKGVYLDGEIVVGKKRGKDTLSRTSSGVTSGKGKPKWRLWVFDAPRDAVMYKDRLKLATNLVKSLDHPQVRILESVVLNSLEEFLEYLELCLKRRFEGVMLRDPEGKHKQGKATLREQYLMKVKPFETHTMRITDYFEEMANTNEAKKDGTGRSKRSSAKAGMVPKGTLGGLVGIDTKTEVEVRVGGGFTAKQRRQLWKARETLLGQYCEYSKQVVGEKDKPRHTSFVSLRPDWDISELDDPA